MLLQRLGMAGEGGELALGGASDAALETVVLHDDRVHGLLRRLREQMLEGLSVADQPGELVLRRGGDQMFEPLALRGDGFDRILGGLGELLLEGVGVAGKGSQRLLRRRVRRTSRYVRHSRRGPFRCGQNGRPAGRWSRR